jgi:outer membrane usher protein
MRVQSAAPWLRSLEMFALLLTTLPLLAKATDQILLLEVQINGNSTGKIGEFILRNGALLAQRNELHDLGLKVQLALRARSAAPSGSSDLIYLSALPGVSWRLDAQTQTLYITADNDRLLPTLLPDESQAKAPRRSSESGTGVTLDYDLIGTVEDGKMGETGSLDLLAFSPVGVVSSDWLGYGGVVQSGTGTNKVIRLDSAYSFADINTLRRYTIGDFITGGLSWTRPIRLTGAQLRSDFSMRPDLVTFPMPSVTGSAAVPSTVQVLVDGNLVVSRPVDAGPFQTPQLPVVSGAGTISMTVTNALGQQVTVSLPFYASSSLLAPKLQTFAVQTGLVRRNWGLISDDYGKLAGTAIYRRGLTPKLTVEGSTEATAGMFLAGAGGVYQVGTLGVVNLALAGSSGSGGEGALLSAGAQRIGRVFSIGGSTTLATRNFKDVATINGDTFPRKQLNGSTGLSSRHLGSIAFAYGGIDRDAANNSVKLYIAQPKHTQILSASYSIQVGRHMSIYVTEFQNLIQHGTGGLQLGLTIPFGRRNSTSASVASDGSWQVQAQQPAALVDEWGYQAYLSAGGGNGTHTFAEGQYKAPWALLTAGVDSNQGQTTLRLETQGAFSLVDGGLFPSNTIYDSFAIVDTNGLSRVHVLQENRPAGSTDSTGRLLVPDLRSFDINRIATDPGDIPQDSSVDVTTREVRPKDRSGVVVKFRVKVSHGALLRLVDAEGVPIPIGSDATLKATGITVPVGYDGNAYLEDLGPVNEVIVELPSGHHCSAVFSYRPEAGDIPLLGPLFCREKTP